MCVLVGSFGDFVRIALKSEYRKVYTVAMMPQPEIMFPSVDGRRLCKRKREIVMSAPYIMLIGRRNMLEMQCSKPIITNEETGR